MDAKTVDKISGQVYSKFPEVSGSRPSVQEQTADTFLLIFKGSGTTADGKHINRSVRVVASASGKIIKITTSR